MYKNHLIEQLEDILDIFWNISILNLIYLINYRVPKNIPWTQVYAKCIPLVSHLRKIHLDPRFVTYIKLLFTRVTTSMLVNGCQTSTFPLQRKIRQGCPLALLCFLSIGETLNIVIKDAMVAGSIKGITLSKSSS